MAFVFDKWSEPTTIMSEQHGEHSDAALCLAPCRLGLHFVYRDSFGDFRWHGEQNKKDFLKREEPYKPVTHTQKIAPRELDNPPSSVSFHSFF